MSCPHDFQPVAAGSRVHICTRCATVRFDQATAILITDRQATALGFTRNSATDLLQVSQEAT